MCLPGTSTLSSPKSICLTTAEESRQREYPPSYELSMYATHSSLFAQNLRLIPIAQVSDEYVLRLLINAMHIEGTLIAPTRREADELLQRVGRGLAWSGDLYTVRRYPYVSMTVPHVPLLNYRPGREVVHPIPCSPLGRATLVSSSSRVVTLLVRRGAYVICS